MATNANWTIVFEDKKVIKNHAEGASGGVEYVISDDSFWGQDKFSNIWAIQSGTANSSDEVEYRDDTPHSTFADANIGDISQFSTKWDAAHLVQLQANWDEDVQYTTDAEGNVTSTESEADQITRKGARPTSYSS
mgnify:FL=1|jgi:hypothetical protein|tara:strand:+ start:96 stop:500 length:405 start_codon:yes stop_codon:yes gene_type:complete